MSNKLFQKAIAFSMVNFATADASAIVDTLREDRTSKDLHRMGVERLHAALISLGGMNPSPEWAAQTALQLNRYMQDHTAVDPTDGQWRRVGFTIPMEVTGEAYGDRLPLAVAIPGTDAIMMCLEERERVLPSVSINRETAKRVAAFEKREDRAATRKDWAMIKDDVTQQMLKTAPIRPKYLPIMISRGMAFFFTTSPKASDEAGTFLRSVFGTWPMVPAFDNFDQLQNFMNETLWGDLTIPLADMDADHLADTRFYPTDAAKLEDRDDGVNSLTKQDLSARDGVAQSLKDARFSITIKELAMDFYPNGVARDDATQGVRLNLKIASNGVFKKLATPELSVDLVDRTMDALPENRILGEGEHIARSAAGFWLLQESLRQLMTSLADGGAVSRSRLGLPYWRDHSNDVYMAAEETMYGLITAGYSALEKWTVEDLDNLIDNLAPIERDDPDDLGDDDGEEEDDMFDTPLEGDDEL